MATESLLAERIVHIIETNIGQTEFVLKLKLRREPSIPFKNGNKDGSVQKLIFIDEEGTKIQAALFSEFIEKWDTLLEPSKVYYVNNGRIKRAYGSVNSVNDRMEFAFTHLTEIKECSAVFENGGFTNGFSSFNNVEKKDRKKQYDISGILVEHDGLKISQGLKRRVALITNESHERVPITLWEEHAVHDGLCLDAAESCKTIV